MLAKGSMPVVAYPVAGFLLSLLLLLWNIWAALPLLIIFGALSALTVNFFRDPDRKIGKGLVSPADGVLNRAEATDTGAYFSIFMNVHDVHVNRAPWPGRVVEVVRISGPHRPAYEKGASKNERVRITIEGSLGAISVTQMVGIVARRILPYVAAGKMLEKGERIGIIRLGSRVVLYVPHADLKLVAKEGDRVLAGTTTLALVRKQGAGGRARGAGDGGPGAGDGKRGGDGAEDGSDDA
jgi:phosphatidylserine decarboxylase